MVSVLILQRPTQSACLGTVPSQGQSTSVERRWRRFFDNQRVRVSRMYVPLVIAALRKPIVCILPLDTTVLWDRYWHDSSVAGVLWSCGSIVVGESWSKANVPPVAFKEYQPLL